MKPSQRLFEEDEKDSQHQAGKGCQMVPVERLAFEDEHHDNREDRQGNDFLNDFQLHQVERSAVTLEADAIGRHGEAVFKEGDAPRKQDDTNQRPRGRNLHFLQFEVPVPGKSHEDVGADQHQDGPDSLHSIQRLFRGAKIT